MRKRGSFEVAARGNHTTLSQPFIQTCKLVIWSMSWVVSERAENVVSFLQFWSCALKIDRCNKVYNEMFSKEKKKSDG